MASSVARAPLTAVYARELALYRAHHAHRGNWWLHVVCVPIEWLSVLLVLAVHDHRLAWLAQSALAGAVLACGRPRAVSTALAVGVLALAWLANAIARAAHHWSHPLALAAASWTLSWALQVPVGHWALERNQPSMSQGLNVHSVALSVPLAWDWAPLHAPPTPAAAAKAAARTH